MAQQNLLDPNQSLYAALTEIGLSTAEQKFYVLSLVIGPVPAAELANRMGLTRPNVYKLIASLRSRGLIVGSERGKYAKTIVVEPPRVVAEMLSARHAEVGGLSQAFIDHLPHLSSRYRQGKSPARVKACEEKDGFVEIYRRIYEEADGEVLFFGDVEAFWKTIGESVGADRVDLRLRRKTSLRALVLPGSFAESTKADDRGEMRETRIVPEGLAPFDASFHLSGNTITFWQTYTPMAVVVIDEHLASMMCATFEFVWKQSR